jgi:acylphosphatase
MEEKLRYKIHITGRVQGVGFRWNAVREAGRLGIKGLVKNLSDGSVYVEAEGTTIQLRQFVVWCRQGTGFSSVDEVNIDSVNVVNYTDFHIES